MIEAPHYSATGRRHPGAFALPADLFDGTVHEAALHQAVKTFLANQRQGTAQTKTRGFVSGGNRKPWRQKGTGRARQGSIRSPLWRGGGIVFGPVPRDYRAAIPRKVRSLARRSAFNARAREGSLFVVDPVALAAPRTRELAGLLETMGLGDRKVLVLTHGLNRNLYLSGRNLPLVRVMSFAEASAYDILWADALVVERGALGPGGLGAEGAEGAEGAAEPPAAEPPRRRAVAKKPASKKKTPAGEAPGRVSAKKPAAKTRPAAKSPTRRTGKKKE
jgi:large subunit ribosomal protein L4